MPASAYVNRTRRTRLYVAPRRPTASTSSLFMGSGYGDTGAPAKARPSTRSTPLRRRHRRGRRRDAASTYGLTRSRRRRYPNAIVGRTRSASTAARSRASGEEPTSTPPRRYVDPRLRRRPPRAAVEVPDRRPRRGASPLADLGRGPAGRHRRAPSSARTSTRRPARAVPYVFVDVGSRQPGDGPVPELRLPRHGDNADTSDRDEVGDRVRRGHDLPSAGRPLFTRDLRPGHPEANCGYPTEALFRGTVQPTSGFECSTICGRQVHRRLLERVFFGGTRLSLPNTKFAPPTPLACGTGEYPCRSQFDSILYALGARRARPPTTSTRAATTPTGSSGTAASRPSRCRPTPTRRAAGSRLHPDEGLMKGVRSRLRRPGVPPTATTATANVSSSASRVSRRRPSGTARRSASRSATAPAGSGPRGWAPAFPGRVPGGLPRLS